MFNYCCWLQNIFFCKMLRIIVICTDAKLFILNSSITHALKSTTITQNNAKQLYLTFVYTHIYLSVHTVVVFFLITSVKTWWKFFPILRWTHPWKESIHSQSVRSCNPLSEASISVPVGSCGPARDVEVCRRHARPQPPSCRTGELAGLANNSQNHDNTG